MFYRKFIKNAVEESTKENFLKEKSRARDVSGEKEGFEDWEGVKSLDQKISHFLVSLRAA
jgi:hypothetical protein